MTFEQLRQIADSVEERQGWDFSRMKVEIETPLWDYEEVVKRYLKPEYRVLDIGTGGGERFAALAQNFSSGVGIDPDVSKIEVARQHLQANLKNKLSFEVMSSEKLDYADESFDIVLNRHAPLNVGEAIRVLRAGGIFITQQVGYKNTANLCSVFNCTVGGTYQSDTTQSVSSFAHQFEQNGCTVIGQAEYNVPYFFRDIESLIFWLKAIPFPEDFDIEKHWKQVDEVIVKYNTPKGIATNEHRELLIVQKQPLQVGN